MDTGAPTFRPALRLKFLTLTRALYLLNLLLISALIIQLIRRHGSNPKPPLRTFLFNYQRDISNAMEAFDFMHRQRVAAKPIAPPEDEEGKSIIARNCRWFWNRDVPNGLELQANVEWSNDLWQCVADARTEIYLYSAFFDHRPNVIFPKAVASVQIIGQAWRRLDEDLYCQIWTHRGPFTVKALQREIWQRAWDPRDRFYLPILFTCPLPSNFEGSPVPKFVSLITIDQCGRNRLPSTYLPIQTRTDKIGEPDSETKRHAVVCVKGMDFLEDLSLRFVEWLELNFHVGADKVVIYTYAVHPRMRKVIEYYKQNANGRLEHVPLTLPGHAPNAPLHRSKFIKRNRQQKRRNEIIPYNDCLYRHIATHEFVLIVDVDELVVPLEHRNWKEMLNAVKLLNRGDSDDSWTAFSIANAFFFDNFTRSSTPTTVPTYMHILGHDRRSRKISPPGIYGKSFMDTRNVATVFNHFPLHRQRRRADAALRPTFYVDLNLARKNHYKASCPIESRDECPDLYSRTVRDDSATRYAQDVAPKIRETLKNLAIDPKSTA